MMSRLATLCLAGLLTGCSALTTSGADAAEGSLRRIGARVEVDDNAMSGLIAGGAEVSIKGHSTGRVVLFGADVQEDAEVDGDLYAAAADIRLGAPVHGSAELFASRLMVSSSIERELTAAGATIEIGKDARLGGPASLTGSRVVFNGQAAGPLRIEASQVELRGSTQGPLQIESPNIHIGSEAKIDGDVDIYTIADPQIDAGAKIGGKVNRHSLSEVNAARALAASGPVGRIVPGLFLLGSALMAGLLFLWLGRGGAEGVIDELIDNPASSGIWGLATIVLLPLAAVLLILTIIGLPVAAFTLLALPLLLLLGYACAGLGLGEWFFNRLGEPRPAGLRALHLLAGLICLSLLSLIPWAGPVIVIIATLCGLGALLRTLHDRMRGPETA